MQGYTIVVSYLYIFPSYLVWHYAQGLKDIARVWTNLLWFVYNFFSLPLLLKTFFEPWRRITETRVVGKFSGEDIAEVLMTNVVMRFVGALLRAVMIVIGTIAVLIVFWGGIFFYVAWVFLPILVIASFFYGLSILII